MQRPKLNSFISDTGIYLISNIFNGVIPFILLPILTRYLGPSAYGEVAIFQTLLIALGAFVGTAFVGAANRKYYDANVSQKELAEYIGSCIQLVMIFTFIVLVFLLIFQNVISKLIGLTPKYIIVALIVAFCTVIIRIRLGQWQVKKEAFKYGKMQISYSLLNMLLSLLFVVIYLKGADGRINAQAISAIVFFIISLCILKKDSLLRVFIYRKHNLIEALKYGIPLTPHIAGGFLLTSVDRFVINDKLGIDSAGIYMAAVQLTLGLGIVFDAINKAYVPWLYEKLKNDYYEDKCKIVKLTYSWFLVIIIGVILSFFIGPPLVVFIAGDEFSEAGNVIGWLTMGQGFQGMYLMVTNYIFYSKKTGWLSIVTIISGLINLFLMLTLIQFIGLKGVAIAYAISMGIRFILTWYVANKQHSMPWFKFIN